ncbi:hypothetical protein KO495_15055 [Colwellia sp. D2M02]|uniref:YtxH domain-containing protein n=1 Tax=Colwellia asteriadis TaxID=517723 RepID=A0ABN1L421_9GAMM|nr:hypothetical protein [Colwellia sp. D2M02]MBU2894628.1 hypothetical protein [Colwellia sp. D2M02]
MNTYKNKTLALITVVAALSLGACSDDGAEELGEEFDKVVSDTKDAASDAGNAIEDACEDVKDKLETKDNDC